MITTVKTYQISRICKPLRTAVITVRAVQITAHHRLQPYTYLRRIARAPNLLIPHHIPTPLRVLHLRHRRTTIVFISTLSFRTMLSTPSVPNPPPSIPIPIPTAIPVSVPTPVPHVSPCVLDLMLDRLPADVFDRIFSHLSMADIHRLHLSGAGASHIRTHHLLHLTIRRRVHSLQRIIDGLSSGLVRLTFKPFALPLHLLTNPHKFQQPLFSPAGPIKLLHASRTLSCAPPPSVVADFGQGPDVLYVERFTAQLATAVATDMPLLRRLYILTPTPLPHLPRELSLCTQLRSLHLFQISRATTIPTTILHLHALQDFQINGFRCVTTLPQNIGMVMSHLRFFKLGSSLLTDVPSSLLTTLERNFKRSHCLPHGVFIRSLQLPANFWTLVLNEQCFPNLSQHIQDRQGAFHPSIM